MNGNQIESLRDAMLEEAVGQVIALAQNIDALVRALETAVPNARSEIEKGGEFAALRFARMADERVAQFVNATREVSALRELLLGEVASAATAHSLKLFREEVAKAANDSRSERIRDLAIAALFGALGALGVGGLLLAGLHLTH
ncbi:hypothetical protein [Paraburkholderia flagellata]|uniref:hypothetical protein n=1 Tax=Paraburkholderia flagellata TaxID=2883241 RepID=UPI001F287E1F|nr:hypothetical protein [Paraburkholderia flagellata]